MSSKILKQQLSILSKKDNLKLSFGKAKKGKTNVFGQKKQKKHKKTTLEKVQQEQSGRDYLKLNLKYLQKTKAVKGKGTLLDQLQQRKKTNKDESFKKEEMQDAGLGLTKTEKIILGLQDDDGRFNDEDEIKQMKL